MKQWLAPVRMGIHYFNGWIHSLPYRLPMPLAWQEIRTDDGSIRQSIALGISFLQRKQSPGGAFRGFLLPPGCSDGWIPAHIAFVLEDVPEAHLICRRIAAWLVRHGPSDGGWGYNRIVGIDNDSTVQALMVLQRQGYECPLFITDNLIRSQHPDGGFPTYRTDDPLNSWQQSHTDITFLVYALMRRMGGYEKEMAAAARWLAGQSAGGRLAAFWWGDDWYNTWAGQKAGWPGSRHNGSADAPGIEPLPTTDAGKTFTAGLPGYAGTAKVTELLSSQLADGSWPCPPVLRVPSQRSGIRYSGEKLYADPFRVFSTCHAIARLAEFVSSAKPAVCPDQRSSSPYSPLPATTNHRTPQWPK